MQSAADSLVEQLAFARENFTPGLDRGQRILTQALEKRGIQPEHVPFEAPTMLADVAAIVLLVVAGSLTAAGLRRSRRALVVVLVASLFYACVVSGVMPTSPHATLTTVEAVIEPPEAPRVEVILMAHYDTKTELLDHVERSILFGVTALLFVWAVAAIAARARRALAVACFAALGLLLTAAQQLSPRILAGDNPGVVDDAAACALLVDLAGELRVTPPRRVRVRILWFAAEELGALGSASYVRSYERGTPVYAVNLEAIGAGDEIVWAPFEWTRTGPHRADRELERIVSASAPAGWQPVPFPVWTDAGSFCAVGVPALTILNRPAGSTFLRDLHGPEDHLGRYDARGTQRTRRLLLDVVRRLDAPS